MKGVAANGLAGDPVEKTKLRKFVFFVPEGSLAAEQMVNMSEMLNPGKCVLCEIQCHFRNKQNLCNRCAYTDRCEECNGFTAPGWAGKHSAKCSLRKRYESIPEGYTYQSWDYERKMEAIQHVWEHIHHLEMCRREEEDKSNTVDTAFVAEVSEVVKKRRSTRKQEALVPVVVE